MQAATKKRVGVLRGGTGKSYKSSLEKGGELISYITDNLGNKYQVADIFVDKDHMWHFKGVPVNPSELSNKVDVVWNTSHPSYSNILESLSIPHIGISGFASVMEGDKDFLRKHVKSIGLSIPRSIIAPKTAKEVFEKFGSPWIVKNYNEIMLVKTFDELTKIIDEGGDLIVEEFIPGKVASVHTVPKFRGAEIYTFPLGNAYGHFSMREKEQLFEAAKNLHKHIGAGHYLKSDFILNPRGKVYVLDVHLIPNLKDNSHFREVCQAVGTNAFNVLEHIIESV